MPRFPSAPIVDDTLRKPTPQRPSFPARVLLLVALLLLPLAGLHGAPSGDYLNRFWQTAEGMPSNVVSGIARDAGGFLWIGTGAGVARFDGVRFEIHSLAQGLPDTQVHALHLDHEGRIWAGTRRGAAYYKDGKWTVVEGLPVESVFSIGEAKDGSIWLGMYRGCWRWSRGKVSQVDLGEIPADTRSFLDDGYGGLWILTAGHLCRWYPDKPGVAVSVPGPWNGHDLRDLARDAQGRMVICGSGVLLRDNDGEWENLGESMPSGDTSPNLACTAGPEGTLWVATRDRGLLCLDEDGDWSSIDAAKGQVSLDDVRALLVDDDGLIWAGTNGGGLNLLRRRPFESYASAEGLGRTVTSSLVIDCDGSVLAGTDGGGILRFEGGRFVPAFPQLKLPQSGLIWSLCAARDGTLWAGTYRDGLLRIRDRAFETISLGDVKPAPAISALFEAQDGRILIGTGDHGVWCWSKEGVTHLGGPQGDQSRVHDILEDRAGNVWAACGSQGLWRWAAGEWQRIGEVTGKDVITPSALLEGEGGELWIGTLGQGLLRYRGGKLDRWSIEQGLASEIVVQLLEEKGGNLWVGTDTGLQRLSRAELDAGPGTRFSGIRLGREDGLPTPQFSGEHGNLCVRAADGSLWLSLASGAIHLDPRKFSKPPRAPLVSIESASTDRGPLWLSEGPLRREEIVVAPGSGTLKIRIASPEFVAPERVRLRYRMSGLENEWQEIDGGRVASYASLPPGSYRFEAAVAARDGTWTPLPAAVPVEIQPFFHQTLAFRIPAVAAILILLGFGIRAWSLRRIRKRMALLYQEQRVERERARIASDLHDDLGASLTEVNFLGTLAADAVENGPLRQRMIGIVERVQRMAKSLDEIVWTVNPANDTLSSTANYLCSRTEESLRAAGIRCRLSVDEALPKMVLDSDVRHQLLLAVNEAVNNVMKHSGSADCHVAIAVKGGILSIAVEDSGRGFDPAAAKNSERSGLANFRKRMESIGGSCKITSSPGGGTRVELTVPLSRATN